MEWKITKISASRDGLWRKHGVKIQIDSAVQVLDGRAEHLQRTHRYVFWHGRQVGFMSEWTSNGVVTYLDHTLDDDWMAEHSRAFDGIARAHGRGTAAPRPQMAC